MVSALSIAESCLIWMATSALSMAEATATREPALNASEPGRTITITPMKPQITAAQRRARTRSPSIRIAAIIGNIIARRETTNATISSSVLTIGLPTPAVDKRLAEALVAGVAALPGRVRERLALVLVGDFTDNDALAAFARSADAVLQAADTEAGLVDPAAQ